MKYWGSCVGDGGAILEEEEAVCGVVTWLSEDLDGLIVVEWYWGIDV